MPEDFKEVYTQADFVDAPEPETGFLDRIMLLISKERRDRSTARTRVFSFGLLAVLSFLAFIPAWGELQEELAETHFSQFASLIFSDWNVLAPYWQDFIMSLAEALPVFGILAVCASLFVLLFSLRFLARDLGVAFRNSNFMSNFMRA